MKSNIETCVVEVIKTITVPKLETYKQHELSKYDAESTLDHGGDYTKRDRYRNRVRVADIILASLKVFVESYYKLTASKKDGSIE